MTDQAMYLKSTRTGKHFRVISLDKEANTITLKGRHGQWTEKLRTVAEFKEIHYDRVIAEPGLEMGNG